MKDNKTKQQVMELISRVRYVSIYNLQPWYRKTSKLLNSSLCWSNKILYGLENEEKVTRVGVNNIPPNTNLRRYNTFFKIKGDPLDNIAYSMLDHQSGVHDILIAFVKLFPYYDVTIKEQPVLRKDGYSYQPDAVIKLRHYNTNKEYYFVLEFERTKAPNIIDKKKFKKLFTYGKFLELPENTKILYVYSTGFDNYLRPMQYTDPITDTKVNSLRYSLRSVWEYMKHYSDQRFLLMAFPDFYRLDEAVWLNCKGDWVKLI